ncbi:MAG: hypothetical protein KDC38_01905 [Planctomycetes bacterium]|nr:hypothetical protein [Planctomycetota bacterium]
MTDELRFLPTDFERFRDELARDPTHNAERLEVRRKLDAFGKRLAKILADRDLAFSSRASLHHPYRFNAYKVDTQFVYLSRAESERKSLKKILGVELGKDLDQNYVHVVLNLEIHQHGLELALRIHQNAWWDGENFKRQVVSKEHRPAIVEAMRAAPGFDLRVHDHRKKHPCETMTEEELTETIGYYTPGEHWLHVEQSIERNEEFVSEPGLEERLVDEFRDLIPLYRAIRWTPKNDFLFGSGSSGR